MSLRKIGLVGPFMFGEKTFNGQSVKARTLKNALEKHAEIELVAVDSHGWRKRPFSLYREVRAAFKTCDAVVMLPAHNGVRVFGPLLARFKRKFGKKIFYDVIGGWLPEFLADKKRLAKTLKNFDGIWTETETMKTKLEAQGFDNVTVVPNFKEIEPLDESELVYSQGEPLRLCTFSRVMPEKGIEDAVEAVKNVNERLGRVAYSLDIYGNVEDGRQVWFDALQKNFPDGVSYKGRVDANRSVETLREYFALLFPTRFFTEGIPGTIIDAYAAGVPVVSARWESFADVVDDGVVGFGYEMNDVAALEETLFEAANDPSRLLSLKRNCVEKARRFTSKHAVELIREKLGKEAISTRS